MCWNPKGAELGRAAHDLCDTAATLVTSARAATQHSHVMRVVSAQTRTASRKQRERSRVICSPRTNR